MKSEEIKQKISEIEKALVENRSKAESLQSQGGELAARGNDRDADKIFSEAEKADTLSRRLDATLLAARKQLEETLYAEDQAKRSVMIDEVNADFDRVMKQIYKLGKNLETAWDALIGVTGENPQICGVCSGAFLLANYLKSNKSPVVARFHGHSGPFSFNDFIEAATAQAQSVKEREIKRIQSEG